MSNHMKKCGCICTGPEGEKHKTQLGDCGIGEHTFNIVFGDCNSGCHNCSQGSDNCNNQHHLWSHHVEGGHSGNQIDSRCDHRRCVNKRSEEHTSELQSRGHLVC